MAIRTLDAFTHRALTTLPVAAGLALLTLATAPAAQAQTAALNFTTIGLSSTSYSSTRGYAFDVTGPGFTVTYLSFFDASADGLNETHTVGLWNPSGTLLASVVIPSGTVAPLDNTGQFRFVNVTPVSLTSGTGYTVGATFLLGSSDQQATDFTNAIMAANLSYAGGRVIETNPGILTRPTDATLHNGYPGGSFGGIPVAAVAGPEPASGTLLLVAGIPVIGLVRRRKKH